MRRFAKFIGLANNLFQHLQRKVFPRPVASELIGRLPYRHDTLTAYALAQLIDGVLLTDRHLATVSSKSKLKDVMSKLRRRYGWISIQLESEFVKLSDGTESLVSFYRLPDAVLKQIDTPDVGHWVSEVNDWWDFSCVI